MTVLADPHLLHTLDAFAQSPLDNDDSDPVIDLSANLAARSAAELRRVMAEVERLEAGNRALLFEQRHLVTAARDLLEATQPMCETDGFSGPWLALADVCARATVWRGEG